MAAHASLCQGAHQPTHAILVAYTQQHPAHVPTHFCTNTHMQPDSLASLFNSQTLRGRAKLLGSHLFKSLSDCFSPGSHLHPHLPLAEFATHVSEGWQKKARVSFL